MDEFLSGLEDEDEILKGTIEGEKEGEKEKEIDTEKVFSFEDNRNFSEVYSLKDVITVYGSKALKELSEVFLFLFLCFVFVAFGLLSIFLCLVYFPFYFIIYSRRKNRK
jgi:hypothetical protein